MLKLSSKTYSLQGYVVIMGNLQKKVLSLNQSVSTLTNSW